MAAASPRLEIKPKQAFLRNGKAHEARSLAADEKIARDIGPLPQQEDAAALAEHDLVGDRRHSQPPTPGAAVAVEHGAGKAHGGQRALHVAHSKTVEAPVAAREAHDRDAPGVLVARFHRVHVGVEDDVASTAGTGHACDDVRRLVVRLHGLGRNVFPREIVAHDLRRFCRAAGGIDARCRNQPCAQRKELVARRVDLAAHAGGQIEYRGGCLAHRARRTPRTSSGVRPTMER